MTDNKEPIEPSVESLQAELQAELDKRDAKSAEAVEKIVKELEEKWTAKVEEAARAQAVHSVPGSEDAKGKDGRKFSFGKAMYGVATGDWSQSEHERDIMVSAGQKAMATAPDSAGGFVVPVEIVAEQIIPLLYASSVAVELGATTLNGLTANPTYIPRVSGGTTAYWVGEGATITASDLTLEQLALSPKICATLTVFSDLLGSLSNPAIDGMIRADMARQIALKVDLAALKGAGAAGEPLGLQNTTGVTSASISDPATFDQLLSAVSTVRGANGLSGNLGWACSNADMLEFEQIKDATSGTDTNVQPLQRRTMLNEDGTKLLGYPVKVSTQLSDGEIFFGNWADLLIANWGSMKIDSTNAVGFTTGQNHIRTLSYVDVGVRHAASFVQD